MRPRKLITTRRTPTTMTPDPPPDTTSTPIQTAITDEALLTEVIDSVYALGLITNVTYSYADQKEDVLRKVNTLVEELSKKPDTEAICLLLTAVAYIIFNDRGSLSEDGVRYFSRFQNLIPNNTPDDTISHNPTPRPQVDPRLDLLE